MYRYVKCILPPMTIHRLWQIEVCYVFKSNEIILSEMIISRCIVFGKSQISKNIKSLTRKQRAEKNSAHCFDD